MASCTLKFVCDWNNIIGYQVRHPKISSFGQIPVLLLFYGVDSGNISTTFTRWKKKDDVRFKFWPFVLTDTIMAGNNTLCS